jgi:hypothetical protein
MVEWWTDLMMTAEMVLKSIGSVTVQPSDAVASQTKCY